MEQSFGVGKHRAGIQALVFDLSTLPDTVALLKTPDALGRRSWRWPDVMAKKQQYLGMGLRYKISCTLTFIDANCLSNRLVCYSSNTQLGLRRLRENATGTQHRPQHQGTLHKWEGLVKENGM